MNMMRAIVASHYNVGRPVSDGEVKAEIANLVRRRDTGLGWFDSDALLAAKLQIKA
jgi:hypothetical protein